VSAYPTEADGYLSKDGYRQHAEDLIQKLRLTMSWMQDAEFDMEKVAAWCEEVDRGNRAFGFDELKGCIK
jgi:hypothetical protein